MENWETWLASQGQRMPAGKQIYLGSTYVVSIQAALHGAGLAMAHDTVASDLLDSEALVRPCAHSVPMSAAYFLTAPPRHGETPASRAFVRWVLDETARSGTRPRGEDHSGVASGGGAGGAGTESAQAQHRRRPMLANSRP